MDFNISQLSSVTVHEYGGAGTKILGNEVEVGTGS